MREGTTIGPFYRRLEAAIRAVDPDHILFLDGNRYSTQFDQLGDPLPNCVYTAHDYALPGFVDGGPYPGVSRGEYVDRDRIEETFLARTAYMRETGTPIWVGEFGPVYTGDPERDEQRYRLLEDQLEIFDALRRELGAVDLQGHRPAGAGHGRSGLRVHAAGSRRCSRRRRASAWTPGDRPTQGVRHILEPIEQLFRDEFPDFEPYPWGARRWIHGHVRHVMLAEAMVGDFARAFAGVGPDDAERLADAFAFENCIIREPLAAILRRPARIPPR